MTTIAADFRAGIMVSDSRCTAGEQWFPMTKVHRVGAEIIGLAGNVKESQAWLKWYASGKKGAKPKGESYAALVRYAEAKEPTGPWGPAVKILTHANYTFYNPRLHPEFTAPESPILIFEGTYTAEFADHAHPTPRYNYNQILYRLDLDDPKLGPAQKE